MQWPGLRFKCTPCLHQQTATWHGQCLLSSRLSLCSALLSCSTAMSIPALRTGTTTHLMRHKSDPPLFSLKNKVFEQLMRGNKGVEERIVRKRVSPTWRSLYRLWMQELKGERKILQALDVQEENRKGGNSVTGTGQNLLKT